MNIVIDTREQLPYEFENSISKGLNVGDYSIEGYEHIFAVERKSLNDFVSSITQGRDRFEAEIKRAADLEYFAIVIETDTKGIWSRPIHSKINRKSIIATAVKWSVKHNIPIFFASNRSDAKMIVEMLCEAFLKYYPEKHLILSEPVSNVSEDIDQIIKEGKT